jgi:hypothetical protein
MRKLCLSILALLAAPAMWAQPTLKVTTASTTSPASTRVYDSLGIVATPRDSKGRRVPTATVTWVVRSPALSAPTLDAGSRGQRGVVTGASIGQAYLVASWKRTDKTVLRDSVLVAVNRAAIVTVRPFTSATLGPSGLVLKTDGLTLGQRRCFYVVAYDKRGGALTGLARGLKSLDTTVLQFRGDTDPTGAPCPDTTVDPVKLLPSANGTQRNGNE